MEEILIEKEIFFIKFQNNNTENHIFHKPIEKGLIQFHFALKGYTNFLFNIGSYIINLQEEKYLLLYNPQKELPLSVELAPNSWTLSLFISIQKLHSLFTSDSDHFPFLSNENKDKKYYTESEIKPAMAIVLNQIFQLKNNSNINLYSKAKAYELLSLIFNKNESLDTDNCPFLKDEENVLKIKKAKEIIIENLTDAPTLEELANQVGISLKKLKEGFKQIYGDTVFGYLLQYKMEYALNLLNTGSHNVNEVAIMVGYSTSSHFIEAFKKRYGTTPKKYLNK
jgi:AraC-like DNA-binding protein